MTSLKNRLPSVETHASSQHAKTSAQLDFCCPMDELISGGPRQKTLIIAIAAGQAAVSIWHDERLLLLLRRWCRLAVGRFRQCCLGSTISNRQVEFRGDEISHLSELIELVAAES